MKPSSDKSHPPADVGDNVTIPIPDVDKGRGDLQNIIGVILQKTDEGLHKVGTKYGILQKHYCRTDFNVCIQKDVGDIKQDMEISLRTAATKHSVGSGQGFMKCTCMKNCTTNKICKKNKDNSLDHKLKSMDEHQVVPDVVDKSPSSDLEVSYGVSKVNLGNELTPTQVKDMPNVTRNAEEGAFYTLCVTDADAPSRKDPKFREWHHQLVVNIPGSNITAGETHSEYVGSGPSKGTGLHRYCFFLYKKPGKVEFDEKFLTNRSGENRGNFSIRNFAKKHALGDPVAGNLYQAQWDDYVPKLYEQLNGKSAK
ncbi:phosphatidylethanolamine-binding protein 1-like [Schistocerca gregaria]|uniref:phosphatidylethanolamine-binding protein 1-like n=1 Tax=Schistocerca gregaria TaxID=7010 RepID=UPI00211DF06B|nr:phosphatidylethanolamine-binding protein 1-like [Schistocerca gregaria]